MAELVGPTATMFVTFAAIISFLMIFEVGPMPFITTVGSIFVGTCVVKAIFGNGGS